jgi:hypothetical protein
MVRRTGNGFECTVCGATLECGPDANPQTVIVQSGGQPAVRAILVAGAEIHRCAIADLAVTNPQN